MNPNDKKPEDVPPLDREDMLQKVCQAFMDAVNDQQIKGASIMEVLFCLLWVTGAVVKQMGMPLPLALSLEAKNDTFFFPLVKSYEATPPAKDWQLESRPSARLVPPLRGLHSFLLFAAPFSREVRANFE